MCIYECYPKRGTAAILVRDVDSLLKFIDAYPNSCLVYMIDETGERMPFLVNHDVTFYDGW